MYNLIRERDHRYYIVILVFNKFFWYRRWLGGGEQQFVLSRSRLQKILINKVLTCKQNDVYFGRKKMLMPGRW